MMDTILNLGLNDKAVEALAKLSNNPRFAYDSYRRLIQMFGDVVLDVPKKSSSTSSTASRSAPRSSSTTSSSPMRSRRSSPSTRSW
jgi:phosphoenolpyruvate synthase/pyruvate phosphate dikinase